MNRLIRIFIAACIPLQLFSQDPVAQADDLLSTCYKPGEPGAAVAILHRGKTILKKGYGLADLQTKTAISATTNFNIGSLTKQFTAYCILLLAKEKKLSLDDPIGKYFPGFNASTGNHIRIRELLTHSSGIMDHYAYTDTNEVKHATDKDALDAVKHLGQTYFPPGTHYRYSNTAYCLLGMIIEKTSGLSYAAFIQKNIFDPLAMLHSTVFRNGAVISRRATGYDTDSSSTGIRFNRSDAGESIFFSTEADGGIYTSIDDYLKWRRAWQTGKGLDKPLLHDAQSAHFTIDSSKHLAYGYGWFISDSDSAKAVYHTGSNGGFRAIVFFLPEQDYTVIIFSNRTGTDLEELVRKINRVFEVSDTSFSKIESLVSFVDWPIFAPCKKIPSFSTSSAKSSNASVMASN